MIKLLARILGSTLNLIAIVAPKLCGKISFHLFCFPAKAKLKSKQQDFLNTGRQKTMDVEGKKVMTYSWGQGPEKILLVHGWQSNSYRWKNYIDLFDPTHYQVITFDAPGHGNSEGIICNVPLYEKSMIALQKEYGTIDILIGHSIGSFASAYFLSENNHSIKKYVSLASPCSARSFIDYYKNLVHLSDRTRKYTEEYFEKYAGHKVDYFTMENFCKDIHIPTLIIHDQKDKDTSVECSKKMDQWLSNSHLILTENLGHNLKGTLVLEKIKEFVIKEDKKEFQPI